MRDSGRGVHRKTADVRFVNDAVHQGKVERLIVSPIEIVVHHHSVAIRSFPGRILSPCSAVGEHTRIGTEQHVRGVKAMHVGIGIGLHVEAETILQAGVEPFHEGVPHLSGAVGARIEGKLDKRLLGARLEKNQRARRRVLGEDGEVDALASQGCAQGKGNSAPDTIARNRRGGRFFRLAAGKRFGRHGVVTPTGQEDG